MAVGKKVNKLEKLIFQIIIFLMPTQLGKHFWPSFSKIYGIRIDYLSPTLYLSDVLIGFLFLIYLYQNIFVDKFNFRYKYSKQCILLATALVILVGGNVLFATTRLVSIYKWLKVFEFSFLAFFVYQSKKLKYYSWLIRPLFASLIVVVLVMLGQVYLQKSIGGIFYYLGERRFYSSTPGIALASILGHSVLRPYSTFSHPNSLAGFLLVSLFLIIAAKNKKNSRKIFLATFLMVTSVFLTFSLNACTALIIVWCLLFLFKRNLFDRQKTMYLLLALFFTISLLSPIVSTKYIFSDFPQTIQRRIDLSYTAGLMVEENPLFGVGLGNFITNLPNFIKQNDLVWWLQPVHNIFLLTFSESGLVGLILFAVVIFAAFTKVVSTSYDNRIYIALALLAIILTGALDHYWLTLQQNQLLFSVVLGLSFRENIH